MTTPGVGARVEDRLEVRFHRGGQPAPRRPAAGSRGLDTVEDALHALLIDRQQKRLLVGNVEVDRARRHLGRGGEFADGGRVITLSANFAAAASKSAGQRFACRLLR